MKWHRLQEKREHRMNVPLLEELGKLEQRMDAQWRLEKLREVELQQTKVAGEEQVPRELENGSMMFETSVEAIKPYDFKVNNLCMFAGVVHDDKQSLGIVKGKKEERQNLNSVMKKDEIARS